MSVVGVDTLAPSSDPDVSAPDDASVFGAVSEDAAYAFLASLAFLTGRDDQAAGLAS